MVTGVNIAGPALVSPTNSVTVSGFTVTQIVRFSKPLAAASSGVLTYDAYSLDSVATSERFALVARNNSGGPPQNGGVKGGWTLPDALLSGATRGAAFTVLQSNGNATSLEIYLCGGVFGNFGTSGNTDIYGFPPGGTPREVSGDFGRGSRTGFNDASALIGAFRLLSIHSAPSDYRMYMDGVAKLTSGTNTVAFAATGKRLGWSREGGSDFQFDGKFRDVVFTNHELSTANRQRVEGYLAWDSGIVGNLDSLHPHYLSPPATADGSALWTPLDLGSQLEAWFCVDDLPNGTWPFNSQLSNGQTWTDRSPNAYVATLSVNGAGSSTRWDTYGIDGSLATWQNTVSLYGVNGGGDHLLFSVPRYPAYVTEDAAFDSIADLLPVDVSGYTSYKITAVDDSPDQADNLGGFSIEYAVVGDAAVDIVDAFTIEVSFSESLTTWLTDTFRIELTTNGTPYRDPPFDCEVPEVTVWTRSTPVSTAWACARPATTTWLCSDEIVADTGQCALLSVSGGFFLKVDGSHLLLIECPDEETTPPSDSGSGDSGSDSGGGAPDEPAPYSAGVIAGSLQPVADLPVTNGVRNAPNKSLPAQSASLPTGAIYDASGAFPILYVTQAASFSQWDFSGVCVMEDNTIAVAYTDCYFKPPNANVNVFGQGQNNPANNPSTTFTDCTFDLTGPAGYMNGLLFYSGSATFTRPKFINASVSHVRWTSSGTLTMNSPYFTSPGLNAVFGSSHCECVIVQNGSAVLSGPLMDARAGAGIVPAGVMTGLAFVQGREGAASLTIAGGVLIGADGVGSAYALQADSDIYGASLTVTGSSIAAGTTSYLGRTGSPTITQSSNYDDATGSAITI
jgi:hypothetical protein